MERRKADTGLLAAIPQTTEPRHCRAGPCPGARECHPHRGLSFPHSMRAVWWLPGASHAGVCVGTSAAIQVLASGSGQRGTRHPRLVCKPWKWAVPVWATSTLILGFPVARQALRRAADCAVLRRGVRNTELQFTPQAAAWATVGAWAKCVA